MSRNASDVEKIVNATLMVLDLEDEGWTLDQISDGLNELLGADPDVPPEPPAADAMLVQVTALKTNARYKWRTNAAGRPIMQIYPSDDAPVKDRVQYKQGATVRVLEDIVKADGGKLFYALKDDVVKNGAVIEEQLYLQKEDVKVV